MTLPVEQFSYLSWMKSDLKIEEFSVESLQVTPLNIPAKVWFNELDRVVFWKCIYQECSSLKNYDILLLSLLKPAEIK